MKLFYRTNSDAFKASSEPSSDGENEEDYVVYEYPGLALVSILSDSPLTSLITVFDVDNFVYCYGKAVSPSITKMAITIYVINSSFESMLLLVLRKVSLVSNSGNGGIQNCILE